MAKFTNGFFRENQKTLLTLLNSGIGSMFRRGMGISNLSLPVVRVTPDSCHVALPDGRVRATIFSGRQHAESIHRNYRPIWEAIHAWDMRFANRFMPAWNMGFDTYSSQPDETSGIDTFLDSFNATTNNETQNRIWMGENNSANAAYTTLIKFDFSTIPSGAVSSAASLTLTIDLDRANNAPTYKFYRSLRAWVEAQATWNIFATSNNWGTAGSRNATSDYGVELASLALTASDTGAKVWSFSTAEMDKYFDGTYTNNGFVGFSTSDVDNAYAFASSSHATAGSRPKFDVTYDAGGGGISWWT